MYFSCRLEFGNHHAKEERADSEVINLFMLNWTERKCWKMMYFPAFKLSEVYSVGGILIYMGMKQFMLHLSGSFQKFYNLGLLVAFYNIFLT